MKKGQWQEGRFYTLESKKNDAGDPATKATITTPGASSAIELVFSVAGIPLIGAPFSDDEMEKAKRVGELLVERFWPSEEAVQAIVLLRGQAEATYEGGPE